MGIHDTLFFKDPINYLPGRVKRRGSSVIINQMTDNNYRTFSTETDIDIDMRDRAQNATRVDYISPEIQRESNELCGNPDGREYRDTHSPRDSHELGR